MAKIFCKMTFKHLPEIDSEIQERERHLSLLDRIYWAYYIHLPFYLMTTGEAFVLHSIMFVFVSFLLYGIGMYLPSSCLSAYARLYYYVTGEDLLEVMKNDYLPIWSEKYLHYIDFKHLNATRYIENML